MRLSQQRYFDKPNDGAAAPVPVVPPVVPGAVAPEPVVPPVVPAAAAPVVPPEPAQKPDWRNDRIAKLTHDLNEERRNKAAAPVVPAPAQGAGESPEAFQKRVDEAATIKARDLAAQADWDRQCNEVADAGKKDYPDFLARLSVIQSSFNPHDPAEFAAYNDVIAAAIETGQAHKVIYALGADPGEYQRLMKLSPVKRAMELGTMAAKLVADPEPSGLPKPITPVGSGGVHYEGIAPDDPNRGMKLPKKEWYAQREKQAQERGIQ